MKATIFAACIFLTSPAFTQDLLPPQHHLMNWVIEKIAKHGELRNNYYITVDDVLVHSLRETQVRKDTAVEYGLISYCGSRDIGFGRDGVQVYFRLTDIACVEKDWKYDDRCITLHIDTVQVFSVSNVGGVIYAMKTEAWPHYTLTITLPWRREPGLFRKLYKGLALIASTNKRQPDYSIAHNRFAREAHIVRAK